MAKAKAKAKPKPKSTSKAKKPKPKAKTKTKPKPKPKAKPRRAASNTATHADAPSAASAIIDEAMAEAEAGNFERAAILMLDAAVVEPTDWRLPNEAGIYYYRLERYDDALRCYDQALAIVPENVPLRMNRALVFILTNRDDDARAALREVLELDSLHGPAYFELGKLEQKAKRFQDALEYFNTALVHETLGTIFNASGAPPSNPRVVFLAMLNKARIFFELDNEADGVAQIGSLWAKFRDDEAVERFAVELDDRGRTAAAQRVRAIVGDQQPSNT